MVRELEMLEPENLVVREYFSKLLGKEGLRILETVPDDEEITDEEIARLSETKLTTVRRMLYTLYENRIAEYRTERDDESGWITYLWRFNRENIKKIMRAEAEELLKDLESQLEEEREGVFYQCNCQRVLFEEAAAREFWCDKCGSDFEFVENSGVIKELREEVEEIEKWMQEIKRK